MRFRGSLDLSIVKIATSNGSSCRVSDSSTVPSSVDGSCVVKLLAGGKSEIRCNTSFSVDVQSPSLVEPSSDTVPFGHRNKFWQLHHSSDPTKSNSRVPFPCPTTSSMDVVEVLLVAFKYTNCSNRCPNCSISWTELWRSKMNGSIPLRFPLAACSRSLLYSALTLCLSSE